ncbi:uncharacterized protein LOC117114616 [Anneissia japonica]|uniref:uncharacterized protein LOC117114616 n=1 Tax=Anneissia japonica TaxID=1529436 RepID=UPI001425A6F2|nr:uncharacterized protein LOC117114616 [Anneissia japonica]
MEAREEDDFLFESTAFDCGDAAWVDLVRDSLDEKVLYDGCTITDLDSVALLMAFYIENKATKRLMEDVLHLIRKHMPKSAVLPNHLKSTYHLRKLFLHGKKEKIHQHNICHFCCKLLSETDVGVCATCEKPIKKNPRFFVTIDIASQLNELYKDPSFRKNLTYRETRKKPNNDVISDIYDGSLYKENLGPGGFLNDESNLSMVWHTDGALVSKSSNVSIWPVQAVINELPPRMRFTKERTILFGLWFGKDKPLLSTFLMPIIDVWNDLQTKGVVVKSGSTRKTVRIKILAGTMDLPAMSMVKEIKQFNSFYGCGICEERGVRLKKGKGSVQAYPYCPEPVFDDLYCVCFVLGGRG